MIAYAVRLVIVAALLALGGAAAAWAEGTETLGVVQRVDATTSTVYLTNGSTVRLDPGARLFVGSRQIQLTDVQPGWTLVVPAPAGATSVAAGPVLVQPTPNVARPPIDATGVVSRIDPQAGTITLEDGRVLHVTPRTTLWQPLPMTSVTPGASIYVRGGEPIDFRPAASGQMSGATRYQMGTVSRVDADTSRVTLSDGTVVHLQPGARLQMDGRPIVISDLRPGDEIVIGVPAASSVSVTSINALPEAVAVEGQAVYVVRRPQAP